MHALRLDDKKSAVWKPRICVVITWNMWLLTVQRRKKRMWLLSDIKRMECVRPCSPVWSTHWLSDAQRINLIFIKGDTESISSTGSFSFHLCPSEGANLGPAGWYMGATTVTSASCCRAMWIKIKHPHETNRKCTSISDINSPNHIWTMLTLLSLENEILVKCAYLW